MSKPYRADDLHIIKQMLSPVPVPRLVRIRQSFKREELGDIAEAIQSSFAAAGVMSRIKTGDTVAIAVGSRGVAEIVRITLEVVRQVRAAGGEPFIIPAMGSHGGATAEGQRYVLQQMGVTEQSVEAPVRATMDTVEVGRLQGGMPVYLDRYAHEADHIIVINRVKPHTAFRGKVESGLMKMMTIGLGKHKGAETVHASGFGQMSRYVWEIGELLLRTVPILCGVATVENAYDRPVHLEVVPAGRIPGREPELLQLARQGMASLPFDPVDVLVVDEIGKDISGDGMDPNITGRFATPYASGGIQAARVVVLDLTRVTDGNINGLGLADITTHRVFEQIQWEKGYANALTSTVVSVVKIPMVMPTEELAVKAAIRTCNAPDLDAVRLVRIRNTLDVEELWISESLAAEAQGLDNVEILSLPQPAVWK